MVTLVCETMAGDPPISYSWTGPNGRNTAGTISIGSREFGVYTCIASNAAGMASINVELSKSR